MKLTSKIKLTAGVSFIAFALFTGCKSAEDKALDQAKAQAASTNTAQQIQYVDAKGQTVTTTVQPPPAPGQPEQLATTTTPPPTGAPTPAATNPVITPVNVSGQAVGPTQVATGNPAAPGAPAQAPTPPPPVSITVPAGSELAIRINQYINVKHAHAGDRFTGEVVEPVMSNGTEVIPRGTHVGGRIDEAHRRGHFKGASVLELRLTSITLNGADYALDTHDNVSTKRGKGKRSAGFIAGMTGAGMIIGGIATGGVGLAIGGAAGAGAGTLLAGTTGNRDIVIPAESIMHFRLSDDLVVQNP
jgi:hypothetical protein